jgi:predicted nucleic acid-binding protein
MSIYLDTSVLIPTLIEETASGAVEAYLRARQERVISDLAAVEVASVLSRLVRIGVLATAAAVARLTDFEAWRGGTSSTVEVRSVDARLAYAYVRRFELMLRAPDALHLAIVHRLDATLVTLDRRLADAARQLGIAVDEPGGDTASEPR